MKVSLRVKSDRGINVKKRLQGFIAGLLVCSICFSIPVFAAGVTKTIKAIFNQVTVKIDGKAISGDKFSYNGNVFVSVKSIADYLGKEYTNDKSGNIIITTKKTLTATPSITSKGKEVLFPDKDLDTYIRQIIKKTQGSIYEGDLLKILSVNVSSENNICNLEGIQYLKNLKSISLDTKGDLKDISLLANLAELQTVIIENKKISDISSLSRLKNLNALFLDGNCINNLDAIANISTLKTLSIANNNIKSLDGVENLANLEQISFGGNSICDITPLKRLTKLKDYYKSSSNLTITKDNKYYSLDFIPTLNINQKNYFLDRFSSIRNKNNLYIDMDGKIYSSDIALITTLMNASKKQYDISNSDNPFIDGVLNIKSYDYRDTGKYVYTSINSKYYEGKITNKEGMMTYEYSLKPNEERGVIKLEKNVNNYLYSINDICSTFDIKFSVEFDKEKKLCGFKFE